VPVGRHFSKVSDTTLRRTSIGYAPNPLRRESWWTSPGGPGSGVRRAKAAVFVAGTRRLVRPRWRFPRACTGSVFPSPLESRCRAEEAPWTVVQEAVCPRGCDREGGRDAEAGGDNRAVQDDEGVVAGVAALLPNPLRPDLGPSWRAGRPSGADLEPSHHVPTEPPAVCRRRPASVSLAACVKWRQSSQQTPLWRASSMALAGGRRFRARETLGAEGGDAASPSRCAAIRARRGQRRRMA
jgi:hypothetical protein